MNANRLWMLGGVAAAAVIAVLAWFLGISPQHQIASAAAEQNVAAQSQLQQTELQLAQLKKEYASIDELKAQIATLQRSVPSTSKVTDFVRQLAQQSAAAGVAVTSITVGAPTAYAPTGGAPAAPAAPAVPSPTAGAGQTPAPTQTPTPDATSVAVAPPVATDPLVTPANFVMLPVSLAVTGEYPAVMSFTSAVQNHGPRLFLVNKIGLTQNAAAAGGAAGGSAGESANLSGYVYVLVGN